MVCILSSVYGIVWYGIIWICYGDGPSLYDIGMVGVCYCMGIVWYYIVLYGMSMLWYAMVCYGMLWHDMVWLCYGYCVGILWVSSGMV
jgi:hypothetical protein